MNKTIVKIFVLLLVVVLLAVPVFAGGDQPNLPDEHEHEAVIETEKIEIVKFVEVNGEIQPRSFECPYCSNGEMYHYSTTTGDWETIYYVPCRKGYTEHTDAYQEKVTTIKYKCGSCAATDTSEYVDSRYICR